MAGVFPAYAGMSRSASSRMKDPSGFPRLRGDEPMTVMRCPGARWFSPPTRG